MWTTKTPWCVALVLPLAVTVARAQQPAPATGAHVIRIETGSSWGVSGANSTTVDSKTIRYVSFLPPNVRPLVNARSKISTTASISPKEWRHLVQSINMKALLALPSPNQCLACVDAAETSVLIEFSDGTRKQIDYDPTRPPLPVKTLLQEIGALYAKHHSGSKPQ
jgi:hypothetical protein